MDARAYPAQPRAAVAAGGRVPELVPDSRQGGELQDHQEELQPVKRRADALAEAVQSQEARIAPSGSIGARNLSARMGLARGSSRLGPFAAAITPSGRRFFSTRNGAFSAVTVGPNPSST
jgi:hypothetical protein